MKFHAIDQGWYQIESDDGRLKLGRSREHIEPKKFVYHVSWNDTRGAVAALEERTSCPSMVHIAVSYAELKKSMDSRKLTLSPNEENVFIDTFASAICELSRLKQGKGAEILRTEFVVELEMPSGVQRTYKDGRLTTN